MPGEMATLTCQAEGANKFRFNRAGYIIRDFDASATYSIPEFGPDDAALYSCEAMNGDEIVAKSPDPILHFREKDGLFRSIPLELKMGS